MCVCVCVCVCACACVCVSVNKFRYVTFGHFKKMKENGLNYLLLVIYMNIYEHSWTLMGLYKMTLQIILFFV